MADATSSCGMFCKAEPPIRSALAMSVRLNLALLHNYNYVSLLAFRKLPYQPPKLQVLRHHSAITE